MMLTEAPKPRAAAHYLRPAKAAKKLGVSLTTLWRWSRTITGFPKPIKLGTRVTVFLESEIDAFIACRKRTEN